MKRKFLVIICGLMLCFGCVGCSLDFPTKEGNKNYNTHSKLISIEGVMVKKVMAICHHIIHRMESCVNMIWKRK